MTAPWWAQLLVVHVVVMVGMVLYIQWCADRMVAEDPGRAFSARFRREWSLGLVMALIIPEFLLVVSLVVILLDLWRRDHD